jgi:hypothetical protein
MSSRGRFATPADFALQDSSPYRGLHARRGSLGFAHRSRTSLYHPVPNLSITIFARLCIAVRPFPPSPRIDCKRTRAAVTSAARALGRWRAHCGGEVFAATGFPYR